MAKVVAIVGPTAVGKTALSLELAQELAGEVISGDSMQVYRGLDIGTAKVTPAERALVPHHLIDVREVTEGYSAADFQRAANQAIDAISVRGKLPIIVGGTGLYVQALVDNLNLGEGEAVAGDSVIREYWARLAEERGPATVWEELNRRDPTAAAQIPVGNLRRVIRALEVIERTGRPFSAQPQHEPKDDFFLIGLTTARPVLYQRINARVDQMAAQGLVEEARWLNAQGPAAYQARKGIGYRELWPYLAGEISLDAAVDHIKRDSRHYAKRQLTWFRNRMRVHWYDLVSGQDSLEEIRGDLVAWLRK